MERESTEAFMERFKAVSMHVNGASKCMRVSRFMHGITNPDLIKWLNDNIPKSVDETMSVTTTFLKGEVAVANQSRKKGLPTWRHHEAAHKLSFDKRPDFKNKQKLSKWHDRFAPLTKTLKEILAMDTVKFKAPPPMSGLAENWNKNKFCEFQGDKGHSTDECIHLKKQIKEAVKMAAEAPAELLPNEPIAEAVNEGIQDELLPRSLLLRLVHLGGAQLGLPLPFCIMLSSVLWPLSPWNSQNLFLFQFSARPDIGDGALNFTVPFFLDWLATATSHLRNVVVTLIISSTDFGMLSFNHLIKSGLVMPCMNPDTLMHFEAPLTCMLTALKHSMKASVDSPSIYLMWLMFGVVREFYKKFYNPL
nr:reverse transcriptase domain-containing protein [Tanacetum cinerariifolium]